MWEQNLRRDAGVHEIIVAPRREHSRNRTSCITASSDMSAAKDRFSNCLRGNPDLAGRPGAWKRQNSIRPARHR
jgi:hypothetical protein